MKDLIKIGVVNFETVWGNKEKNLEHILLYCHQAGQQGVHLLVFPETALSGYDTDIAHKKEEMMHTLLAETIPGPSTDKVAELAKEYNMYIVFGMPEKADGSVYNSAAIVHPNGNVSSYRKIHLPFDEATWASLGDKPYLIETPWGPIGISICYDTYCFPELIRYYRAKGARLTLNVTACPDAPCTQGSALLALPAYSYINYIYIASANLCGKDKVNHFIGGSAVIGLDQNGKSVKTYIGHSFDDKEREIPGLKVGEINLSLVDEYAQIPIFRKNEKGESDFRFELYSKIYQELSK